MYHKRAGDTSYSWCGKKIGSMDAVYWWRLVDCPQCQQTRLPRRIVIKDETPQRPMKIEDVDMNKLRAYFNEK